MFKYVIERLPWSGDEVKAKIERQGREGARLAAEYMAERTQR